MIDRLIDQQVRYGDRFVEELHLPVEVLSFEGDLPGSTGTPRSLGELPSGPSEVPALEATRLAHASPLPWGSPAQEVSFFRNVLWAQRPTTGMSLVLPSLSSSCLCSSLSVERLAWPQIELQR